MGNFSINNGGVSTNKKIASVDVRYGPYDSTEAAKAALGQSGKDVITSGLTVGIRQNDGNIKEYWFKYNDKNVLDLVPKNPVDAGGSAQGHFAAFDENGNLGDSGKGAGDFAPIDQAVPNPQEGDEGKILGYEIPEGGNKPQIGWVEKPQDGITPQIDQTTKHWMIGEEDTEIDAEGKDAYQIAVSQGYEGTKSEWLDSLKGEKGDNAVNPFKGWLTSKDDLPDNPHVGDYAYVEDDGTTYVYRCTTEGTWPLTSTEEKEPSDATFASAQLLNNVKIDDTHLSNPVGSDETNNPTLVKAEDVLQLKAKLEGVTASEMKAENYLSAGGFIACRATGSRVVKHYYTNPTRKTAFIPIGTSKAVRFLGFKANYDDPIGYVYMNIDNISTFIAGLTNSQDLSSYIVSINPYEKDTNIQELTEPVEIFSDNPEGANYIALFYDTNQNEDYSVKDTNFYCYLQSGDNVGDVVSKLNKRFVTLEDSARVKVPIVMSNSGAVAYTDPNNSDGAITVSSIYKYSNPVFVKAGYKVVVKSRGSGFAPVCTCDENGENRTVVVGRAAGTAPSSIVTYEWTPDSDVYVIVCGQFYYEGEFASAWYLGEQSEHDVWGLEEKTLDVELTMAVHDESGEVYQAVTNNNLNLALKTVAVVGFIDIGKNIGGEIQCVPHEAINSGESFMCYFFDDTFSSITSVGIALDDSSDYKVSVPTGARYMRLSVTSTEVLNYSVRYVTIKFTTDTLKLCGVRNYINEPDLITANGTLKRYRTIFEVPYKGQRLVNLGWVFYSPYYQPEGVKTKLVILYLGSDAFKFNQGWSAFTDNYHSIVFSLVHSGYNVALCSCLTSLYGPNSSTAAISDCAGDQLSINAYASYYDYIIKNFNVDEKPYIIAYSNGGMPSRRINILSDIPARAIAGGATSTDLVSLFRNLGSVDNINKIMHNCGVPDDVNISHSGPNFTEEDYAIFKSNGDILKNYSPMFMNTSDLDWDSWIDTIKNLTPLQMDSSEAMQQLMSNVRIMSQIPVKVWNSKDDASVSYGQQRYLTEAINRGGGRAFLRTMPDNAGGHAMGNYGNTDSIKIQNFQFKDGTVADTTLFMSEVIDWFEQWK